MSGFDEIARFYDLDSGAFADDLPMYLGFARRTGGPVLELACGTGRVLAALARAGFNAVGVDVSRAMLVRARERLGALVGDRVRLVHADVRALDLPETFPLAIVALDGLLLFGDLDEQAAALRAIARHLAPDGLLVVDVQQPDVRAMVEDDRRLILDWVRLDPVSGRTVVKLVSRAIDLAEQRQTLTILYDETEVGGTVRRTMGEVALRYLHRSEAELLLARCGYHVEQVYGSYDLEPVGAASERLIAVARKRGERDRDWSGETQA